MKRYFDLRENTYNNYCDDIDSTYMVEIPDDGRPYGVKDAEVVDISQDSAFLASQVEARKNEFEKDFLKTSFGYLRRRPKNFSSLLESFILAKEYISINGTLPAGKLKVYPLSIDFSVERTKEELEAWLIENIQLLPEQNQTDFESKFLEVSNLWFEEHEA